MSPRPAVFRPLRWPRFWLTVWGMAVLAAVVLSLVPPMPTLGTVAGSDKLAHGLAYFVLMASAVQVFARPRHLVCVGVALALLGLGLEWAQGALTATRQFDLRDALANAVGVCLGGSLALTSAARCLQVLERWLPWPGGRAS